MFPWRLHSSVNCSLPKLSPSAFIRWCTHVNFAEWPVLGASYYPGKRAPEPAFKLLGFSSSIAFLSSGSFSCAETNQCTFHILPRSERASGRWAPERILGLLHQRTLGLLYQTWACNLVIGSQGFFCDSLTSKHFHFLQRWVLWHWGDFSRQVSWQEGFSSFSFYVFYWWSIHRDKLFRKAETLGFYQRGVFDFALVGQGQSQNAFAQLTSRSLTTFMWGKW